MAVKMAIPVCPWDDNQMQTGNITKSGPICITTKKKTMAASAAAIEIPAIVKPIQPQSLL
jgi:hypothetical protein